MPQQGDKTETHVRHSAVRQVVPQRQPADDGQPRVAPRPRDLLEMAYHFGGGVLELTEGGGRRCGVVSHSRGFDPHLVLLHGIRPVFSSGWLLGS